MVVWRVAVERVQVALARHGGQGGGHDAAQIVDLPGPAGKVVERQPSGLLILDADLDRPPSAHSTWRGRSSPVKKSRMSSSSSSRQRKNPFM